MPHFSEYGTNEPQVDVRADQGVVEPQPQPQPQIIGPNTASNISMPSFTRQKLSVRRQRSDKAGSVSEPTALPPLNKRRIAIESPSLSSQKDLGFEIVSEQYLVSFSQQDEPIELHHRAMEPCTDSSTLSLLTMGENIRI